MVAALILAMTPPLPAPTKPDGEITASCAMRAPDGAGSMLTLRLRPEGDAGRAGYWWTIEGDEARYPSNRTARNMFGYDNGFNDVSRIGFQSGDDVYTYELRYSVVERFPGFNFVPFSLAVVRRSADGTGAMHPIGIGFCRPISTGTPS